MKNNTAIFLKKEKLIVFKFKNENFSVDLTEGDLEDSWNSIQLSNGNYFDTNFYWESGAPSLCLYKVNVVLGQLRIDTSEDYPIKITRQYGTKKDYFAETSADRKATRALLKEKLKFNKALKAKLK